MPGRNVGCVAAIHTRQPFQASAAAHMTEALILEADRREFLKGRKIGQGRQRIVVNILAADTEAAQRRHFRKRNKSPAAEVGTFAAPKSFKRLGPAQPEKA